ncbi:MAG: hypothetical protein JXL20_02435 [Deltaproteobacteria bacterium]|nr:hypothetical protein [Deltaproteobacteria bacterium]
MKKYIMALCALMLLAGTGSICTAAEDSIICTLTRANDCSPEDGCVEVSIDQMALPRFVRIDLKSKTITSLDKEISRYTQITTIDRLEGMTVMHGTELRGWSIALGQNTGNLTLSASGDGEGFVVFGVCMIK